MMLHALVKPRLRSKGGKNGQFEQYTIPLELIKLSDLMPL